MSLWKWQFLKEEFLMWKGVHNMLNNKKLQTLYTMWTHEKINRKNLEGNTTGGRKCLLQSGMIMALSFISLPFNDECVGFNWQFKWMN